MNRWVSRIAAVVVTLLAAALTVRASWVSFTLRRSPPGWHFGIGAIGGESAKLTLLSYGLVAAVLCVVGFVSFWRKWPRPLAGASFGLLLLATSAFLQVAMVDSSLLQELMRDHQQYRGIQAFTRQNLPINSGAEPTMSRALSTGTVWGRIAAAQFFMGLGWYATIFAGLCGVIAAIPALSSRREQRWVVGLGTISLGALAAMGTVQPVRAHYTLSRGVELESRGDPQSAIDRYRLAMRMDSMLANDPFVLQRIGAIDGDFGRTDTLEYGLYRAGLLVEQNDLPSAIAEMDKLLSRDTGPHLMLRRQKADLWTLYGRSLYQTGATGQAMAAWQNALLSDSRQMQAGFCLSRVYYELGRYRESVDLIASLLPTCADAITQANLLSNQGDAYTKLGEHAPAHPAYRRSYKLDLVANWRALTALCGGN